MYGYLDAKVKEEQLKDWRRDAANERLAAEVQNTDGVVQSARRVLGHGLVAAGRHLLDGQER